MQEDQIRDAAYRKWEEEGRPEGQHERHWREAEDAHRSGGAPPQTMPSDHNSGVSPPTAPVPPHPAGDEIDEPSNDWPAADRPK